MIPRNLAIGAGVLALAGLGAVAHYTSTTQAAPAVAVATPVPGTYLDTVAPAAAPVAAPAPGLAPAGAAPLAMGATAAPVQERVVYRDRVVYRTRTAARPRAYVHRRSKKHSAMIIGGSTVGGAGIGALVGGKKGALIGGLVGGAAGTVYDRKTHKKVVAQ